MSFNVLQKKPQYTMYLIVHKKLCQAIFEKVIFYISVFVMFKMILILNNILYSVK